MREGFSQRISVLSKPVGRVSAQLVWAILLGMAGGTFAADDIRLSAVVDNPSPKVGERFNYTVQADYGGSLPDIIAPDFEGFDIVGGPSVSTSVQIINMSVSKSQTATWTLRPNKSGNLTIQPATVKVRSKTISSNAITLNVVSPGNPTAAPPQGKSQSRPQDPQVAGDKLPEVFLAAQADKTSLMKLDMAVITYRLYLRVNVLNYEVVKIPQATGFWTEEFPIAARPTLEDVTVRGQPYKVATIRRIGVFPTRSGNLVLDPLTIDLTIERPSRRTRSRDPFDSFFDDPFFGSRGQRSKQSVSCEPLTLNVRDFPSGAPANFSGDVGSFDIKVNYDKKQLNQNDALTVKVVVNGRGYLKSIDAPKLELPSGFEQFAPTTEDNISLVGESMRGKKTFTYLVIPRRSGSFTLPPVEFSFIDPASGSYRTVSDGGINLEVAPSTGTGQGIFEGRSPSEITLLDSDIRFVKALSTPLTRRETPPYRSPLFFLLLALGPAGFLAGIGWEKISERRLADPVAVRRRKASEMMRRALNEAGGYSRQQQALKAAETAAKGLAELVGAIIREPTASLTSELVRSRLGELSAGEALIVMTINLLGEADRIRFGGAGQKVVEIEQMLANFRETAASLEKLV